MRNYVYRIVEEIFPLLAFWINKHRVTKLVSEAVVRSASYSVLDARSLNKRIRAEHERGVKIDEKTSKFTLGLSVSLTVLAAASGAFAKFIPASPYAGFVSVACGVASIYMLLAGITALSSLKTLPTYGYGTQHLLREKSDGVPYLGEALYAQETMNIVRQLRNEAAYQSLRNGFIALLVALILSVGTLASQQRTVVSGIDDYVPQEGGGTEPQTNAVTEIDEPTSHEGTDEGARVVEKLSTDDSDVENESSQLPVDASAEQIRID